MLTDEQIKNLKPGDPLVIHTTFDNIDEEGDLWFQCPQMFDEDSIEYIHPKCVSLPDETVEPPKYDPTRLFRKGDKVRVVKCKGRDFNSWARIVKDQLLVVDIDEMLDCDISVIAENGEENSIDPAYLELIIPVEEQEPYNIDPANTNVLFKHGKKFATFEDDDEAQELCDRLNAEWRKELNNE